MCTSLLGPIGGLIPIRYESSSQFDANGTRTKFIGNGNQDPRD